MKRLIIGAVAAVAAAFVPSIASAADLDYEHETVIRERAPVVVRERIIERRYYEPRYEEDIYVEAPYRRHYFAAYPHWGEPRFHRWHRPYRGERWGYGYGRRW